MSDLDQMIRSVEDNVLDVRGAMALLKVGRDAIYTMCARQQLPHRKIGRVLRFSRAALMRWLDSCGSNQDAQTGT